ncbi:SPOR domain-containing protein [Litorimonas sp. RW-G-Af-16]|uniref:SPOR domain-containing protein n=1 Tax=Litorimonas sp. RW-G-Af-16 TaxID=3241168 RepID=UPI00390C4601
MANNDTEFSPDMQGGDEALTPFDVRDSSGRQGLVKLLVGFGILLVAALVVLKLYQPGVRDRSDPPRITAENTPFKVVPEDAGGAQTPDQDKAVFDVMDGKAPDDTVITAPVPEMPIKIPETAKVTAPKPTVTAPQPIEAPVPKTPAAKAPTYTPPAPKPTASANVATGNSEYVVQIASVRSENDAGKMWTEVRRKYPNIVTDAFYADVRRVDLAEKGVYYRTRLAGLADKQAATDMCNALKAVGQACFVTKK